MVVEEEIGSSIGYLVNSMEQFSRPTTPFPRAHQADSAIDTGPDTPSPKGISSASSSASGVILTPGDSGIGSSPHSSPGADHGAEEEEEEQVGVDEDDESAEDEYRRYHLNPAHPRAISKRKQEHSALLRSLANSEALKSSSVSRILDDLSIVDLIKDNDKKNGKKDINRPREYQYELFERAKKKNIIAVLDTGTSSEIRSVVPTNLDISRIWQNTDRCFAFAPHP